MATNTEFEYLGRAGTEQLVANVTDLVDALANGQVATNTGEISRIAEDLRTVEESLAQGGSIPAVKTTGNATTYIATVDGITSLTAGAYFIMIPHITSATTTPKLNVNGLGEKYIRRRVSNSTATTVASSANNWLYVNKPIGMLYDGTYWIADMDRPNATDMYGTLAVAAGGTGATTAASALTNLTAVGYIEQSLTEVEKMQARANIGAASATEKVDNPLYGKKVTFNGDSICAGAGYAGGYGKIIAERNNMTYQNIAHGGATITAETYSGSTGNALHWICRTIVDMDADSDYAIVEGGVNDPNYVTNIGSLSEGFNATLDDTTYYGAFESMLKQLITRFAGKKIGYIAIPKVSSNFDSRSDADSCYHIALECCEKWGVPVCDLNVCVPPLKYIDALSDTYTTDGTHPNEAGYKAYYCDQIEAWMRNLTASSKSPKAAIKEHNKDTAAHSDIRALIIALQTGKLDSAGIVTKKALLPLADGTTIEIDVLVSGTGSIVQAYTNQVPLSIDTDRSVFNGVGYQNGYRLSSSGATKAHTNSSVTGYIPCTGGDVIRIANCGWASTKHGQNYIAAYKSDFTFVGAAISNSGPDYGQVICDESTGFELLEDGTGVITLVTDRDIAYVRVSSCGLNGTSAINGADMIITVNEEITD